MPRPRHPVHYLLTGDGVLAKGVISLAAKVKVKFDIRVKAESFSFLVSTI
jgi:hypothetical protein